MAIIPILEDWLFPAGIFGSNMFFVGAIILVVLLLFLALRLPIWFALILILPVIMIGGGSKIGGYIDPWVSVIVVVGIFTFVGLAYMSMTSGNR